MSPSLTLIILNRDSPESLAYILSPHLETDIPQSPFQSKAAPHPMNQ